MEMTYPSFLGSRGEAVPNPASCMLYFHCLPMFL